MQIRRALVVVLAATLASVASSATSGEPEVTSDEVLSGRMLGVGADPTTSISTSAVLALSDEMRSFLHEHVNPGASELVKLQQLVNAIMGRGDFHLEYDESTRTAAETFRLRHGNCLSFTTMFVALARAANLAADFQEVDIPPDWSTRKDVFVLNRHVNVRLELAFTGARAVDFNIGDFRSTYDVEVIPDNRAIAHFFNNMGVERMEQNEVTDAFAFFRRAILETDGRFSPAWTNLGLLYSKAGFPAYAEAAYLQALRVDRSDVVPMSNLVRLYEAEGELDEARSYRRRVEVHRMRNPYLRLALARDAVSAGDIDAAIEHLKYVTRKLDDEEPAFLLGACYLHAGDRKKAEKWIARAESIATTERARARYSSKLQALQHAFGRVR